MSGAVNTYREKVVSLVQPVLESQGIELVDVDCVKGQSRWTVRIYIDKEGGITLDDCAMVSGEVGDLLDVHEIPPGPYNLEVSSPGLDRPLVKDRDFMKYQGHTVKVRVAEKVEGRKHFTGKLVEFVDNGVEKNLLVDVEGQLYSIPLSMVLEANLQYEF